MADAIGGSVWEGSLLNLLSLLIISDSWSLEPRAAIGGPKKRSGRRLSFSLPLLCCLLKEEGIVKVRVLCK